MVVIQSYVLAVVMCFITMLCWGSWANTQKLASREWRFQLFYWDYCLGVLLWSLILALTLGSIGSGGRGFFEDLTQADVNTIGRKRESPASRTASSNGKPEARRRLMK